MYDDGAGWVMGKGGGTQMGTGVLEKQVERTKTQERISSIIFALESAAHPEGLTYKELQQVSSMPYPALTYIMAALEGVGRVKRHRRAATRGRPVESFSWVGLF